MKSISRDEVLRWVSGPKSQGGSGGGGAIVDLAGYATQIWTEQNYVGKEFFSSLFKAYDANGNEVLPNDTDTQIDNIKAMFGFWTEFYVSALGTGGQQSVGLRLAQLADVNVAGVTNGQVLTYDSTTGKWIASTPQSGTDMATVWANLAASGNQQINYSHLSGAISLSNGTITIGSNSITPITSLAGYAQETWVNNNFLKLIGGTLTGGLNLKENAYNYLTDADSYCLNCRNSDIVGVNSIFTNDASESYTEGLMFRRNNGKWDSFRALDGIFYIHANNNSPDNADIGLRVVGSQYQMDFLIGSGNVNRGIYDRTNGNWLLYFDANNTILNYGNVGIGTSSISYKLHVNGVAYASTGFYTAGYVTALSDARHKNVIGDTGLTVKDIAEAPAIRFTWKDRDDQSVFAGSIAQYWQKVLPEVVQSQDDGTLSLDYQVTALMAAIVTARKVEDHEERLNRLERILSIKP